MRSSRSRFIVDVVLVASIVALSFLPAIGTQETHFAMAAMSLRIIAGIYAVFVVLGNTILGPQARLLLDLTFAVFLACMAWFETFPAGNHIREAAIYAAIAGIVFGMAAMSRREPERVTP